ncbi:DUF4439 domain-containing protein [Arthrobacter sp. NPDC058130]|uniref:DUF4439 domain-containing protein n=1 Tax=Arthrobacter sp. NPDC058130 TaxID=3346353 RepID=UPI0036F0E606
MNDDTREKRWQDHFPRRLPRYALLACLALVVVSLGVALLPARQPEPAEPPFSEQARAAALAETLQLLAAGNQLGTAAGGSPADNSADHAENSEPPAGAGNPAVERTVTLLTTQARALLAPGESLPGPSGAAATDSGRATPPGSATSSATPAPSAEPSSGSTTEPSAAASAAPVPATAAGLVAAIAESGNQRLADAAVADGGMARLLAAVGTGQLLQASALAAGTGITTPPADAASPQLSGTCPSGSAAGQSAEEQSSAGQSAAISGVGDALAAVVRTEAQTIYGYQVALPRLGGDAAESAAEQLARHGVLLSGAERLSELHCATVPPREAGYALGQSFLASPAAGLGGLEAAALPVYGDLVALSDGETRQWAIAALLGTGKRAVLWGADPGALPGLDRAALESLPAG